MEDQREKKTVVLNRHDKKDDLDISDGDDGIDGTLWSRIKKTNEINKQVNFNNLVYKCNSGKTIDFCVFNKPEELLDRIKTVNISHRCGKSTEET